ncbi:MAG: HNH endonuclease, partial [Solirubrobacterales bacterium]|nr:HNH endonuclease [Solirubrobacterales bacterium]
EAGGGCAVCGYDRTVVNLHFHHVDPATKSFALTTARGKSLESMRAEATKCVLVCANCHGEIEAGLIASPPPQAKWGEEWVAVEPALVGREPDIPAPCQLAIDFPAEVAAQTGAFQRWMTR